VWLEIVKRAHNDGGSRTARGSRSRKGEVSMASKKVSRQFKHLVKAHGEFVLDYVEACKATGRPYWFVGRGRAPGNTSPIPSGLHKTPREAWRAAAVALGLADA
jgi:hypothetical protein